MQLVEKVEDIPVNPKHAQNISAFFSNVDTHVNGFKNLPVQCVYDTGGVFQKTSYLCHNYVLGSIKSMSTYIINALTTQVSSGSRELTEWLISDDSPYFQTLNHPDVYLVRNAKGLPIIIGFTDLHSRPYALYSNFLIATRMTSGWALGPVWKYLVQQGFSKRAAFTLLPYFSWNLQTITLTETRDRRHTEDPTESGFSLGKKSMEGGDQPFSINSLYKEKRYFSPKSFIEASPEYVKTPKFLKDQQAYAKSCNYIWCQSDHSVSVGVWSLNKILKGFTEKTPLDAAFVKDLESCLREDKSVE